jgi:hypothetical protein
MPESEAHTDKLYAKMIDLERKLDEAKQERKLLQFGIALATALVTAVIGFAGWFAQSTVQQHIDESSRELEARLALTQQFYGRKLAVYESVYQQMAHLADALSAVSLAPHGQKSAVDAGNTLYVAYTTNSLYLSDAVVTELAQLVDQATRLPSIAPTGKITAQDVNNQISLVASQMKKDLGVEELGQIPGVKSGTRPQ